jgi:hypothetical protein
MVRWHRRGVAPTRAPRLALAVFFAALLGAFAWPMQVNGWNQNAQYALTKALVDGVPWIDKTRNELGDLSTGDIAFAKGHYWAVKAPGLAMVSVPAVAAAKAAGMRSTGDPTRGIWIAHLVGCVLAAVALAAAIYRFSEGIEPGYGAAAAAVTGLATLVLPFSTLFFSHALSMFLGFAAFLALWESRRRRSWRLLAVGGLVGGLSVVTDYSYAPQVVILGLYALERGAVLRRAAAYAGGALAGLLPLFAFNLWAFGSLIHTPYTDYWKQTGQQPGTMRLLEFHLGLFRSAWRFLFSSSGLLVLTPVLAIGAVSLTLLYRRGLRREALALGSIAGFYLVYHTGSGGFGGLGPPRYLTVVVPFLMAPIALALRRFPLATTALAIVSAFQMVVMTATGPLAEYDGMWLERAANKEFMATAASLVGITGWYAIIPYFLAVAVVVGLAVALSQIPDLRFDDVALAVGALGAWALVAAAATNDYGRSPGNDYVVAMSAVVLLVIATAAVLSRRFGIRPVPAAA